MPSGCTKRDFKLSWSLPSSMFRVRHGSYYPETILYGYPRSSSDIKRHSITATITDDAKRIHTVRLYITV